MIEKNAIEETMNGIEKEVDRLGRVVIPVEFRKKLGIGVGTRVAFVLENNGLMIRTERECCALCGSTIECSRHIRLCSDCIRRVKEEE